MDFGKWLQKQGKEARSALEPLVVYAKQYEQQFYNTPGTITIHPPAEQPWAEFRKAIDESSRGIVQHLNRPPALTAGPFSAQEWADLHTKEQSAADKWNFEQTGLTTAQLEAKNRRSWTEARVRGLWQAHEAEEVRIQNGGIDVPNTIFAHTSGAKAELSPSGGDDAPALQAAVNATVCNWLPPDFDSRIGTFTLDHAVMNPQEIMAIMAKCVILSAKYLVHDGGTQYIAKSPLFAVSPKGAHMREYNFQLTHDPDGTIRVKEAY